MNSITWRVFLSHTSELSSYPLDDSFVDAAKEGVIRAEGSPVDMSYFVADDRPPAAVCRESVGTADVYVGIIGFRYGAPVKDNPEVSYTEMEFDTATEQGKPRLIFLISEDTPLPQHLAVDQQFGERQAAFRQKVRTGRTVRKVSSPQELTTEVVLALMNLKAETDSRIADAEERQRRPVDRPLADRRVKVVNRPPFIAPPWFQDRSAETKLVANFLGSENLRLQAVAGRGGVGKTAMVCRLLKKVESGQLPDDLGSFPCAGIVYLSPTGLHAPGYDSLVDGLLRLMPDTDAQQVEAVRRDRNVPAGQVMRVLLDRLMIGPVIVLLDNLEDHINPADQNIGDPQLADALSALLDAPEHPVKVIATSRIPPVDLFSRHPERVDLLSLDEGLDHDHGIRLLRDIDPDGRYGLRSAPEQLLGRAVDVTRGFPRALEAIKAILATNRATSLEEVVERAGTTLPERIVQVLVGDAFNQLDLLAQHVMQALAVYTVAVPPVAVDRLLQPFHPAIDAAPVLTRLVNMQLARRDVGNYHLHPTDRDHALSQIPCGAPSDARSEPPIYTLAGLRGRAADYFASVRTTRESWHTLEDLAPQLAELRLRCEAGDYDNAHPVLDEISDDYLQRWGHYGIALAWHSRLDGQLTDAWPDGANKIQLGNCYQTLGNIPKAIESQARALTIFQQIGDRQGEAAALGNLGGCYAGLGQIKKAIDIHGRSLAISREIGDRQGQAEQLGNMGSCYASLGEIGRAIDYQSQSLTIFQQISDRQGEAAALCSLGNCYTSLDEIGKAIDQHGRSLAIFREIGDRRGEAAALGSLGDCYHRLGEIGKAIDYHAQSLAIAREIGDRQGEAAARCSLGDCYASLAEIRKAIDQHGQSLAIFRELGDRQGEAAALGSLGSCYTGMGEIDKAIDYHSQSLTISREIGDRQGQANQLGNLGICYFSLGEIDKAIDHYNQSMTISREIDDRQGQANQLGNLATCYVRLGEIDKAIDHYNQSMATSREIGDRQGEANQLGNLGVCHSELGEIVRAIDFHNQSLAISRKIGDRQGQACDLDNLGNRYLSLGDVGKAMEYHAQSLAISQEIGFRSGESNALINLGNCAIDEGRLDDANDLYRQAMRLGDATGLIQARSEARIGFARTALLHGQIAQARDVASEAEDIDFPNSRAEAALLAGLSSLHMGETGNAAKELARSAALSTNDLDRTTGNYHARYLRGLAYCALALICDSPIESAVADLTEAGLQVGYAPGELRWALGYFNLVDGLTPDHQPILEPARQAILSRPSTG